MNKFKERFRELRIEKNLSRKQIAQILFVSERLISYWEDGKRECSFDMLMKISYLFDVSIDYLLGKLDF